METVDALIVGGGVAGSVAAKYLARAGLDVVFIEKEKTPRHKSCSGIQFKYFEKIIGERIPGDRLCNHQITTVRMYLPNGRAISAPFGMLNFMRKPLDAWLNDVAVAAGARFKDECKFTGFKEHDGGFIITTRGAGGKEETWHARYLVDASGLNPVVRKQLRPADFSKETVGATVIYYIDGEADMDPNSLYQFWNVDWNDAMFAWAYTKTLEDGKDYWVVGTGCNDGQLKTRMERFHDHVVKRFNIRGEIVKKEGFATTINMLSKDRIWLGTGNILITGDAAGLVDQVRGVGMDAAGLSGRFAARAIIESERGGMPANDAYQELSARVVSQTRRNQDREIGGLTTNEHLERHLKASMFKTGLRFAAHRVMNRFRSPERLVLLPP